MASPEEDAFWMRLALEQAQQAGDLGEVPVGAVLVGPPQQLLDAGVGLTQLSHPSSDITSGVALISAGFNCPIHSNDPTAHAEIVTIRNAGEVLRNYRLPETTLYVTIEPCSMCVGAMVHARIGRLVYGAEEPRAGAVRSAMRLLNSEAFNHKMQVYSGVLAEECGELMAAFFRDKRQQKKQFKNKKTD